MTKPDLEFFFDPACPFCWITSKWIRVVQAETDITVRWSYISLVTLNEPHDGGEVPPGQLYGRQAHRVIAAAADAHGQDVIGQLYEALGNATWEQTIRDEGDDAMTDFLADGVNYAAILDGLGLNPIHAAAVDDDSWDHLLEVSTSEALSRTGEDVGTPIITFRPDQDDASSFFGPIISEVPSPRDSVAFYKALEVAARISSFSELKRTKRQTPQLPLLARVG